ncbi:hypothetical protein BC829DRAFT_392794 [Chytridium lagenaria]|nr:hypothetical protein BC829DRAFT_392794 [Chytridium lagenaria]
MVQGQIKSKPGVGAKKKTSPGPKRGGTKIAPKKATLQKQLTMKKKLAATAIVQTERQIAAKAGSTGKLTIMRNVADKAIKEAKKEADAKMKKKIMTAKPPTPSALGAKKKVKK